MTKDLGTMGESTFKLWCADAGLVANGSDIDRTGWDFFVEFPFSHDEDFLQVHQPAFECKVQVKATNSKNGKVQITLSNLRRLITAQMPSFFVFIEFDNLSVAQRAFILHVDNHLITKVLKKIHAINESDKLNNFNRRKMTIHYDDSHKMGELNGTFLKKSILSHVGDSMAEYVANKKDFLESTGFENGFSQITFTTEGEENIQQLIDVSIGIEKRVELSNFKGINTRFGIISKTPFVDNIGGALEMPNINPNGEGVVKFKESKLSTPLSFSAKIYLSPFNKIVPVDFRKMRIEGEFFDLLINPFTGAATYNFSFGEGIRLEVKKFKNAIKLMSLLGSSGKEAFAEIICENMPKLEFRVGCNEQAFDLSRELRTLESAVNILSDFEIADEVDISLDEIIRYSVTILQFEEIMSPSRSLLQVEFGIEDDDEDLDTSLNGACIILFTTPIGSHIFGVFLVLIGPITTASEERFSVVSPKVIIEKKIVSERDQAISEEDIVFEMEQIETKYESNYSVIKIIS